MNFSFGRRSEVTPHIRRHHVVLSTASAQIGVYVRSVDRDGQTLRWRRGLRLGEMNAIRLWDITINPET